MIRPRTLNHALAVLLALVTVPLLLGALGLLVMQIRHSQELQQTQLTALAQTLAKVIDSDFEHRQAQLEVIASSKIIERRDWQSLYMLGRTIGLQKPGTHLFLSGPDGQQLVNTAVPLGQPLGNPWQHTGKHATWDGKPIPLSASELKVIFTTGKPLYTDLYFSHTLQQPRLALAVPVIRDEEVIYVMGVTFPPSAVQALIDSAISVPGIRASVNDRQWMTVASNLASAYRTADKVVPLAVDPIARVGTYERIAPDGMAVRGAYALTRPDGFTVRTSVPTGGLLGSLRDASPGWLLLAVGTILLSTALVGLISRRFTLPLKELHRAARDGREPNGPATGIEELDMLACALRSGVKAEQQRREELAVSLQRQHSEAALLKSNREKDEFLATLAHELRNPLAPIRTAAALIRRQNLHNPAVIQAQDIIERQSAHMARLVDDLMDVSRVTLGNVTLQWQAVDLNLLARQAAELVQAQAEAAGLQVGLHVAETPVRVMGDPVRLAQCLSNLLHNAVKFTPAGGCIELRVQADKMNGNAHLWVSDSGIGLAEDNLERIFEVFVQSQVSGGHGNSGLGIGLALTRKLVELHRGTVSAQSRGLGRGSVFHVCLPTVPETLALENSAAEPLTAGTSGEPAALASARVPPASAVEPEPSDSRSPLVLVVDDNRDAANMLSEVLALSGFRTRCAYSGESALSAMRQQMPAAVLLDIGLPDISGYEVCQRLRAWPGVTQPLVLAVTGWGQANDRERSHQAGFDAHLTKPTDPDAIVARLNQALQEVPA